MPFTFQEGCIKDLFVTEEELIDRFTGQELWLWGYNANGQLGNASSQNRSSPVQTAFGGNDWKQIGTGGQHSAAIKTDGTLWMWGQNTFGRLGTNSTLSASSPVQTISVGTNWKQVSLGRLHSAAIKTDGTLWLWGSNGAGSIGDNTAIDRSSPVQTISSGTNWKQVSLGGTTSGAIKTDGTLWMWGSGSLGKLGNQSSSNQSSPVQTISGGADWKQVSVGAYHSAAIKTDGTLWLWGTGASGQLGNDAATSRSSPVQTISGGANWKQVSLGGAHSAAIKTDGTLWVWGCAIVGQIGDNTAQINRSSPVQTISGGTNWKQVGLGYRHSAAIKTDGTLWLWGEGTFGQLGNNSGVTRSSPVQTISAGTNWRQVSLGLCHSSSTRVTEY